MKKQSSVDWLINCITEDQMIKAKSLNEWLEIFEQAKATHKEEIIESYYMGDRYSCCGCYDSSTEEEAEDYYIEIFEQDDKRIGD